MGWFEHLETQDDVDDPIAVTSLQGGKRAMRYVFRNAVRGYALSWEVDDGYLSDESRLLRDNLLNAHRNLCRNPTSPKSRERFTNADEEFWAEVERRNEIIMNQIDDVVHDDHRLRGFHEGWVWTFRYTHPDDYADLLSKLQDEYRKEKARFEASGRKAIFGLSMDRAERAWKETAKMIYLAYTDQAALDAMFAPGDEYAAAEEDAEDS